MQKFGWVLALALTTVIVSCQKESSIIEQPATSSDTQTEIATQSTSTTSGFCTAPGGLYVSNVAAPNATLNWSAVEGAAFYNVQWKAASSNTWLNAASATYGTSVNLYSLTAGGTYDWRVRTYCSLTDISDFTTSQFTVSGSAPSVSACPGPNDISTNGTMSGAAAISLNTTENGTIAPANDVDYYKVTMGWYGGLAVYLTNLPANYDLAVYNSSGTLMGISQNKGSKNEVVSLNVYAGDYYIKVFPKGTANNASSCYSLKVLSI